MVAGRFGARGKSELHRARVPGESQGGAVGASTVQIGAPATGARATETNPARRSPAG